MPASIEGEGKERPVVLLVDDDERLLRVLRRGLSLRSFQISLARNADEALAHLQEHEPDLIVLDIMMSGMDGIGLCRLIRESSSLPILMLTARDGVDDRVAGLEAGADDYLVKPFDLQELVARIRALLRRAATETAQTEKLCHYKSLTLDRRQWTAERDNEPLSLTATEFRLLDLFMRFPEQVLTRGDILAAVWGQEWVEMESNVVDVHVANLRAKLESKGSPRIIQTIRGAGYTMRE
jgi:two-component system response regulator MprA